MADIDRWVRWSGSELLFVYGQNDPWGAERFEPGRWTRDTSLYVVAGGTHTANITQLPQAEEDEATATVLRWAGSAATGIAPEAQRQAAAEPEDEPAVTGARP